MYRYGVDSVTGAIKRLRQLPSDQTSSSSHATQTVDNDSEQATTLRETSEETSDTDTTTTATATATTTSRSPSPSPGTATSPPVPELPPRPSEDRRTELLSTTTSSPHTTTESLKELPPQAEPTPTEEKSQPEAQASTTTNTMSTSGKKEESSISDVSKAQEKASENPPQTPEPLTGDETDAEVAKKLSALIDNALDRVSPLLNMINENMAKADQDQKDDCLNEDELVKTLRPLIEQATNILRETHGGIKALDPDGTISNNASRKSQDHEATKEEQHLAESLGKLTGDVTKTIESAREKIQNMPKAKKDLGPLFDALSEPLFQIVSGVGLLLNGVLTLLGRILDGLGLGGVIRGILSGLGLEKILKGLGLTGLFDTGKKK